MHFLYKFLPKDVVCNYFSRCCKVATFTTYIRHICCNYDTSRDVTQISKKGNFVFQKNWKNGNLGSTSHTKKANFMPII